MRENERERDKGPETFWLLLSELVDSCKQSNST